MDEEEEEISDRRPETIWNSRKHKRESDYHKAGSADKYAMDFDFDCRLQTHNSYTTMC